MSTTVIISIAIGIAVNLIGVAMIFWRNSSIYDAKVGEQISHIQEDIKEIKDTYVPRTELSGEFKNVYKRLEIITRK